MKTPVEEIYNKYEEFRNCKTKDENGTYSYRINGDLKVSNIPTEEEALRDAENKLMKLIKQIIKK